MASPDQIEVIKQRIAKLEQEKAEVVNKLDSWWRNLFMPSRVLQSLIEDEKWLAEAINQNRHTLALMYQPPPTFFDQVNEAGARVTKSLCWGIVFGGAFMSWWRYWSIMRMRFAPLRHEQWHWRKILLQVESPYPTGVAKSMASSALYLVWYYSRHPPQSQSQNLLEANNSIVYRT